MQELLLQDAVDSQVQRLRASTGLLDTSMSLIQVNLRKLRPPAKPKTVSSSSKNRKEEMAIVNMESRGLYAEWTQRITQAENALKICEDVARKTVKDQSIVIS